ncbi:GNAT family N-acetyltransferase [Sphingobacterium lactis]|uniref:GNAT family N-acetyltransferase n=1 Tax=Sphingobacterium lactis TaxID=797291 RepID=UPI003DA2B158
MIIRQGKQDEAGAIAAHLLLAMEDIAYLFIGAEDKSLALLFLETLVAQQGNQYSYDNNWVVEENGHVVATALIYDGSQLHELRKPVAALVQDAYGKDFNPEDETQGGEYYIDCIGVSPDQQGKGIGSKILQHLIDEYVEKRGATLGLLVDDDNPNAKRLYERLGFKVVGEKWLMGKHLEHLQRSPAD